MAYYTSYNEKSYLSYVEASGICWAASMFFFLEEGIQSTGLAFFLCAFSLMSVIYVKKVRIHFARDPDCFSLAASAWVIFADFILKFSSYGLVAVIVGDYTENSTISFSTNTPSVLFYIHLIMMAVLRVIYSVFAFKERVEYKFAGDS